ncbi:MAG: isoprenylcysteine carboxylmethyltransferase family protein [Candidatus Omnitrophica bacterium]|nr:isoprenylcysteine carboxylmethyltransferase family protein [Candidatus Omnitrophota bacterium]MBU1869826.1 isoprenylcysteine carboxylmethyltransferase family protein [Candidatus Omnitrophota bacterium]
MKKRIGVQGSLIFLAVVLVIFFSKYLFPDASQKIAQDYLAIIGILMVLKGYFLRIVARGIKAEYNPDGKTLVVNGPYAFTRNPMYFGTLLIGLGIILALFKWWVSFVFLTAYLAIYIPQINREEDALNSRFGGVFRDYCKVTPKFFPRINFALMNKERKYFRFKSSWVKKEGPSLIATFIAMFAMFVWQDLRLFGNIRFREELIKIIFILGFVLVIALFHYEKENTSGKS